MTMNENEKQFLSFEKERVQALTIEQLTRTYQENDIYGKPLTGIYHFDLMNRVLGLCEDAGLKADVWDLFAANNKDRKTPGVVLLPQVEEQFGEMAIEAHVLRRVFANIRLTDFDTDEYTTNLAVSYTQKGIQVGMGTNVKICHNQCMLNPELYASTFKDGNYSERHDLEQMLEKLAGWLKGTDRMFEKNLERIEAMKNIAVPAEQTMTLIGLLTTTRIAHDTLNKEIKVAGGNTYPLNSAQINSWTEDLMLRYKRSAQVTVWDLYDAATNLYKATSMDIPSMIPQNIQMVRFLESQFGI